MSLLFDALNRAQGNDAKPLQMPDASSHLPSGSNEHPATNETGTAKSLLSVGNKPQPRILPYAAGGLALLVGAAAWYFYQQNSNASMTPPQPAPLVAAVDKNPAAMQTGAASSVADAAPVTGNQLALADGSTSADQADLAARPAPQKPTKKRKASGKSTKSGLFATFRPDPLQEGYRALSEGRLDLAEQKYLAVLTQHPHEKDALLGLAVIAQRNMQTQRAADLYQQVLREDIGNVTAAAGLVSLSVAADPVSAESQLKQLLDLQPNAPEFHHALGNVLARQLRWGEAQQAFFRAFSLDPGNAHYAYNLAVALDHLHQPTQALSYYNKTLQLAVPGDPTLDREAIRHRTQALQQTPPTAN